jgi:hypothetical protein
MGTITCHQGALLEGVEMQVFLLLLERWLPAKQLGFLDGVVGGLWETVGGKTAVSPVRVTILIMTILHVRKRDVRKV